MKFIGNTNEFLHLEVLQSENCAVLKEAIESSLTILWFQSDENILKIDGKEFSFKKDQSDNQEIYTWI